MTKEGTIQLTTPLKINGEDYTELTHDIGKITIEDLAEIERERNEMLGPKAGTIFRVAQNDNLMHTLLGMHAIIKCNPKIDINDLKRIEGYDLCQMAMVGLRFFSRPAIQESNDSEKPQEDTQDSSTVLSQSSTKNPLSN